MFDESLMTTATAAVAGGAAFGLAAAAALKLGPLARLARAGLDTSSLDTSSLNTQRRGSATASAGSSRTGWGEARTTEIVALERDGIIRYPDGFGCGWEATPLLTRLGPDDLLDEAVDKLARMLASIEVPGTIVQLRLATGPDPGRAIYALDEARDSRADPRARTLHQLGIEFHLEAALSGVFHQSRLSLWARAPVGLPPAWKRLGRASSRSAQDEQEAREQALRVFRTIERMSPLELRSLNSQEMWEALYLGHHQDARSVPAWSRQAGIFPGPLLLGDCLTLTNQRMVIDGRTPACIVSLRVPPQPAIAASLARFLERSDLGFRHTIIVEFIALDQRTAVRKLDRRIRQVRHSTRRADGRLRHNPDAPTVLDQLMSVRTDVVGGRDSIIAARYYAVIYGPELSDVTNTRQLEEAGRELDDRAERFIAALRTRAGAEAMREDQASLEFIYPQSLVGELSSRETGREIPETTGTLAALAPLESVWTGAPRPHTLVTTPTGRLLGLDLFDRRQIVAPTGLIIGASGSGKSVLLGRLITGVLGTRAGAGVRAVDFGESLGPLVDVLGGRHWRFHTDHGGEARPLNIWDYEGLEEGAMPDETQLALVVGDLMQLARAGDTDSLAEDVLSILVKEVYRNEVPRNGPGRPKHEPVLSHLLDLLSSYQFDAQAVRERAASLMVGLEKYRHHPWLDRPTHPDFIHCGHSRFDVYELNSLDALPQSVRATLAYRVAARVANSLGARTTDGRRAPVLLCFDEVWKIKEKYPQILKAINCVARTGRKENAFNLLASQAYEDFSGTPDVVKNSGLKLIGKQIGDFTVLADDCGLADEARAAVSSIINAPGYFAQFVGVIGSGPDQIVEQLQVELSPAELWTYTTNPDERNARARVAALRPAWGGERVIAWLARHYPRGLTAIGQVAINESFLAMDERTS